MKIIGWNINGLRGKSMNLFKNKNKEYNCLVGMYHDAIQSGLKSFGFEKGVTVQGGLPIPITTPAHGTAFDIVGKNKANVSPMLESLKLLLKLLS